MSSNDESELIADVPPGLVALMSAIGIMTMAWSRLEYYLDHLIDFVSSTPIEKEKPRTSIRRKLRYLKQFANTLHSPEKENLLDKLGRISQLKEQRHNLTHGVIVNLADFTPSGDLKLKLRDKSGASDFKVIRTTLQKVTDLCARTLVLSMHIKIILERLTGKNFE